MSTGTKVVRNALRHIGVDSPLQDAPPESYDSGKDALNSLVASLYDEWAIDMGAVPLETIGQELCEPLGATMHLEYMLALAMLPQYPEARPIANLTQLANDGFSSLLKVYGDSSIPKPQVRSTLPKGQGNTRYRYRYQETFFEAGDEIG